MKIRKLENKDAVYMLEWMQDENLVEHMGTDFSDKTKQDCIKFIEDSHINKQNMHWAIVDDKDEYMGTVSLKNIEKTKAEFAIAIRRCAMGKGYSKYAMEECIKYAFHNIGLEKVYWYVSSENKRAVRFYEKNGFVRVDRIEEILCSELKENKKYIWYIVFNDN